MNEICKVYLCDFFLLVRSVIKWKNVCTWQVIFDIQCLIGSLIYCNSPPTLWFNFRLFYSPYTMEGTCTIFMKCRFSYYYLSQYYWSFLFLHILAYLGLFVLFKNIYINVMMIFNIQIMNDLYFLLFLLKVDSILI